MAEFRITSICMQESQNIKNQELKNNDDYTRKKA